MAKKNVAPKQINGQELTCIACQHFYFCTGDYGYSEYTPGSDASMHCSKNHFNGNPLYQASGDSELRAILEQAQSCSDFERRSK